MIDLQKAVLPHCIEVDGTLYEVKTSFKLWLRFLELLEEKDVLLSQFDFMYISDIPQNRAGGLTALIEFSSPPSVLPIVKEESSEKAVDYAIDADYIYAAFLQQYGIDLIKSDTLHWYAFQALFKGLQNTKLNDIIGYRLYERTGKANEYTKQMEKLKAAWALPEKEEEDEDLLEFEKKLKNAKEDV